MTDLATYVAALAETWASLDAACTGLSPAQWAMPTDLPGWSVQDNLAHVVGVEALLSGEPYPSAHVLPESLPHVKHKWARYMEVMVDVRRSLPGDAVLAEFRDVTSRRLSQLRALSDDDLDDEVSSEIGTPVKLGYMLGRRAFDSWAHEQDIRRALGLPGSYGVAAADISRRRVLTGLTTLGEDVPSVVGRTVVVETTGALPSVSTLTYDPPSYVDGDADADVRIVVDFGTFVALGTGRAAYAPDLGVKVVGDVALGEELLRHFAITP